MAAAAGREVESAEADPFDDAMVAAVAALTEGLTAEASALAELEARLGKVAQRTMMAE